MRPGVIHLHSAIESVALKSAMVGSRYLDDIDSTPPNEGAPSASEKLVVGIEEALKLIKDILCGSGEVLEKFRSEWDAALSSYQQEIGMIDEEFGRFASEQKKRKKNSQTKEKSVKVKEVNQALNFHLSSKKDAHGIGNDGSDMFILPPEDDDELEITCLSYDAVTDRDESGETHTHSRHSRGSVTAPFKKKSYERKHKTPVGIARSPIENESTRFDSRASLITKMEGFREEEELIMKWLNKAKPQEEGMTTCLTMRERQELEDALDRCRSRQTYEVIAMVTKYKPRFKVSTSKHPATFDRSSLISTQKLQPNSEKIGLSLPNIENILEEATAEASTGTGSKDRIFDNKYNDVSELDPERPARAVDEESTPSSYTEERGFCVSLREGNKEKKGQQEWNPDTGIARRIFSSPNCQKDKTKINPTSRRTHGTKILLNATNKKQTEQIVPNDPDNFLTVHELSIGTPSVYKQECPNDESGDSGDEYSDKDFEYDETERSSRQSLSELV